MTTIGAVKEILLEPERNFEWKIENFKTLSAAKNVSYNSPKFSFAKASWHLQIYPNGHEEKNSVGYIDVFMIKKHSDHPISLKFSVAMKTIDGIIELVQASSTFKINGSGFGKCKVIERGDFLKRKSNFAPKDILTFICTLKNPKFDNSSILGSAKCSYCKKTSDADLVSYHERECLVKSIKCPDFSNVLKLKDSSKSICETKKINVYERMVHSFKDIMISGEHSDTIVQVKEVKFQLHKSILAARSPFFNGMFKNDMKEKATGVVTINDCEPDVFHQFVHFLYTGEVDEMSLKNVCSLYEMADKYQDDQLKEQCLNFMVNDISVEYLCEFITLAMKFNDTVLLEKTKEFFLSKPKEIVCHVKWLNFVKEYPIQANELVIKTFNHYIK